MSRSKSRYSPPRRPRTRRLFAVGALGALHFLSPLDLAQAGPYSAALNDPTNPTDAPIPGFVGPAGEGKANPANQVNPLFLKWASTWSSYLPADATTSYSNPAAALGPVTGNNLDVVSLGEVDPTETGVPPGSLILHFEKPIRNLPGADLCLFENGFPYSSTTLFAELAHVEVSSNGSDFARFPSVSLGTSPLAGFAALDPTSLFNLAGKHANAYGDSWGTPFDFSTLATHPLVLSGAVDLNAIRHVRIVDIPGNGMFTDNQSPLPNPIYDPYPTYGTGGFDLEAVGAISVETTFAEWENRFPLDPTWKGPDKDGDGDGVPSLIEYALDMDPRIPDAHRAPTLAWIDGQPALRFDRDVRKTDLIYEVEARTPPGDWIPIARSTGGGPLEPLAPIPPSITDEPASHIASVGVLRRHSVADTLSPTTTTTRLLRLTIRTVPSP